MERSLDQVLESLYNAASEESLALGQILNEVPRLVVPQLKTLRSETIEPIETSLHASASRLGVIRVSPDSLPTTARSPFLYTVLEDNPSNRSYLRGRIQTYQDLDVAAEPLAPCTAVVSEARKKERPFDVRFREALDTPELLKDAPELSGQSTDTREFVDMVAFGPTMYQLSTGEVAPELRQRLKTMDQILKETPDKTTYGSLARLAGRLDALFEVASDAVNMSISTKLVESLSSDDLALEVLARVAARKNGAIITEHDIADSLAAKGITVPDLHQRLRALGNAYVVGLAFLGDDMTIAEGQKTKQYSNAIGINFP